MSDIIVKKDKVSVLIEWPYTDDSSLVDAVRNAQELQALVVKDVNNEQAEQNTQA